MAPKANKSPPKDKKLLTPINKKQKTPFKFNACDFFANTLLSFKAFLQKGDFCDIVLESKTNSIRIPVHRIVVSAKSQHFYEQFRLLPANKSNQNELQVYHTEIDDTLLEKIVQFFYTGKIIVQHEDHLQLMRIGIVYTIKDLSNACNEFFIKTLSYENCLDRLKVSNQLSLLEPNKNCLKFIIANFMEISQQKEFIRIPATDFMDILRNDQLKVPNEEFIFCAFLKWIYKCPDYVIGSTPQQQVIVTKEITNVLTYIRFPLMDSKFFAEHAENICRFCGRGDLITEYYKWNLLKQESVQLLKYIENTRMKRRQNLWKLIVFGSTIHENCFTAELLHSDKSHWIELPTVLGPSGSQRHYGNYLNYDNQNVIISGGLNICTLKRVDRLNLQTLKFTKYPPMHYGRFFHSSAVWNGDIFVAGGKTKTKYLCTAERFDHSSKKWSVIKPMTYIRSHFGMVVANNFLFAIGGRNEKNSLNSVEYYDLSSNIWMNAKAMNKYRVGVAVAVLDNFIYAMGGSENISDFEDAIGCTCTVERFDLINNTWTMIASLSVARDHITTCIFDNQLFAIGGYNDLADTLNIVEIYDVNENKWQKLNSLNSGRGGGLAFPISNAIDIYTPIGGVNP